MPTNESSDARIAELEQLITEVREDACTRWERETMARVAALAAELAGELDRLRECVAPLAEAVAERRGQRGRDYVRSLEFGELLDDLDARWQALAVAAEKNRP